MKYMLMVIWFYSIWFALAITISCIAAFILGISSIIGFPLGMIATYIADQRHRKWMEYNRNATSSCR